jgi:hypothetical protein
MSGSARFSSLWAKRTALSLAVTDSLQASLGAPSFLPAKLRDFRSIPVAKKYIHIYRIARIYRIINVDVQRYSVCKARHGKPPDKVV